MMMCGINCVCCRDDLPSRVLCAQGLCEEKVLPNPYVDILVGAKGSKIHSRSLGTWPRLPQFGRLLEDVGCSNKN